MFNVNRITDDVGKTFEQSHNGERMIINAGDTSVNMIIRSTLVYHFDGFGSKVSFCTRDFQDDCFSQRNVVME